MATPTKQLKFYAPEGDVIRVTHPDGSVARVTGEPRTLPPKFNKLAIKAGCLTSDMPTADRLAGPTVPVKDDAFARRDLIKAKMIEAALAEEGAPGFESAFTNNGLPNLTWLSSTVGFTVERAERDELWREAQAELDAQDGNGNGNDEPNVE